MTHPPEEPDKTEVGGWSAGTSPQLPPPQPLPPPPRFGQQPDRGSPPAFSQQSTFSQPSTFGQPADFGSPSTFGQQPAFGQPSGPGQQPGFGQQQPAFGQPIQGQAPGGFGARPPAPCNRTGLIVGGVIAAVVALLMVGICGVVALLSFSRVEAEPPALSHPTGAPSDELAAGEGDHGYGYDPDFCEQLDPSPVLDLLPSEAGVVPFTSESSFSAMNECRYELTDGRSFGSFAVSVTTFHELAAAETAHEINVDVFLERSEMVEEIDRPWQIGRLGLGDGISTASATLCVRDDNVVLKVDFFSSGPAVSPSQARAAVLEVAEQALVIAAR